MTDGTSINFDPATRSGHFAVARPDMAPCAVSVTRRGLLNAASPPRATDATFVGCFETFRTIALEKIALNETLSHVVVTGEDVRRWRRRVTARSTCSDQPLVPPSAIVYDFEQFRNRRCGGSTTSGG